MPQIQLLDGKKISFTKSINGFDLTKKMKEEALKNKNKAFDAEIKNN